MRLAPFLIVLLAGAAGCSRDEPANRTVQFCLSGPQDAAQLKALVRSIAVANDLQFEDSGEHAPTGLQSAASGNKEMRTVASTVDIGALGLGGRGFTAASLPDAPLQVVVSFSKAGSPEDARKFSDSVIQLLSKRWRLHEIRGEKRVLPLKDCKA